MNNLPSSSPPAVPSICIHNTDNVSALFDDSEMLPLEYYDIYNSAPEDTGIYACSRGSQSEYLPPNAIAHSSAELEDIPEFSHLTTTSGYLTGHCGYSYPHPTILQENIMNASVDGRLSPSTFGSPIHSPTSSFGSSLSPASLHDSLALSDIESPVSPWPSTPDHGFPMGSNHQSNDSLASYPFMDSFSDNVSPCPLGPSTGPQRPCSQSPSARRGPVASKAMLEANGRRRRHPPLFNCSNCGQTFTALFSLKRHAQSHTGLRPFACSIPGCTQRFFNSSDCKRHEKSRKRHKDLLMA